jgi:hypothetical protein
VRVYGTAPAAEMSGPGGKNLRPKTLIYGGRYMEDDIIREERGRGRKREEERREGGEITALKKTGEGREKVERR